MEALRKVIQLIATLMTNSYFLFPFTHNIYQGPAKVICAPGLNCYSCPASTTYCPIGAIQQLLLSVRFSLETGSLFFSSYVVGTVGLIATATGRTTCGWLCPFGLIQELLYRIPCKIKAEVPKLLRYVKYLMLSLFVILFPLLLVNEWGMGLPWFCKYVCPAGTLEAGIPMLFLQPDLRATVGFLFYNKLAWMIIFLVWSVITSRPFCKTTCPLGAFYGLFNKVSLLKLELKEELCTNCGKCADVCPMGIQFNESVGSPECIMCMRCMREGCDFGAITLTCGGLVMIADNCRDQRKDKTVAQKA